MRRARTKTRIDYRSERAVEAAGDRLMGVLGFTSIHFSQSRATQQTPGIPDRKYYSTARGVTLWWEAKTAIGRPSAFQVAFRAMCEACGEIYLCGTDQVLLDWAVERGYCEVLPGGGLRTAGGVARL